MEASDWTKSLAPLLALALRLEGEGYYNLAKLARAAVDAALRRAAYQQTQNSSGQPLNEEIEEAARMLPGLKLGEELLAAFQRGSQAFAAERIPSIVETPHPFVCRTCGHLTLGEAPEKCPVCGAWADTLQWFPAVYWLTALNPPAALEKLRQTPRDLAALLEGLSEQAMTQQPQDGGWAIRNTLIHLRDSQDVLDYRLELFSKDEHPVLKAQAVWNWAQDAEERPPSTREIFAAYQATRLKILDRLEALPLADWQRTGQHEEFGAVTLLQQVSYFTSHELTHLPQIERLVKPPKT